MQKYTEEEIMNTLPLIVASKKFKKQSRNKPDLCNKNF